MPVARLLAVAAIIEAATGIALIVVPSTVGWLLLDSLSGAGVSRRRVAGVALLALGVGGWVDQPGRSSPGGYADLQRPDRPFALPISGSKVPKRKSVASGCDPCRAGPLLARAWFFGESNDHWNAAWRTGRERRCCALLCQHRTALHRLPLQNIPDAGPNDRAIPNVSS